MEAIELEKLELCVHAFASRLSYFDIRISITRRIEIGLLIQGSWALVMVPVDKNLHLCSSLLLECKYCIILMLVFQKLSLVCWSTEMNEDHIPQSLLSRIMDISD